MKQLKLKLVVAVLIALFSLNANAYDACIDGIYYNLVKKVKTAEVTYGEKVGGTYSGVISIPSSVEKDGVTYSVTSIGQGAFQDCRNLTSVSIPNSVISIGSHAFYDCCNLTTVSIPNSVTSIEDGAFYGCDKFSTPVYNSTLFAYMPSSYEGEYVIPDGIEKICWGAFLHCENLTSVTIPNSITSIGTSAFQFCI